ncbi:MAG TPA: hypothetical protein VGC16_04230, partial [Rhizomicrobium sp.]
GWAGAKRRAAGVLDGLTPSIIVANLPGKGRYYRLRTTSAAGQGGSRLCAALTARGVACLPVKD